MNFNRVSFNLSYDYDGLMSLIHDLKSIREEHWLSILYLFSAFYLFKQTFAIPGSFLLVSYFHIRCLVYDQ